MLIGVLGCAAPSNRELSQKRALRIGVETPYEALARLGGLDLQDVPAIEIGLKCTDTSWELKGLGIGMYRLQKYLESLGFEMLPWREDGYGTPSAVMGFIELRFSRVSLIRTPLESKEELIRGAAALWSQGLLYGVDASDGLVLVQPEEEILEAHFDPSHELRLCALTAEEIQAMNERVFALHARQVSVPVVRVLMRDLEAAWWGFRDYEFTSFYPAHDTTFLGRDSEPYVGTALLDLVFCTDSIGAREAALLAVRLWEVGVVTGLECSQSSSLVISGADLETAISVLGEQPWLQLEDGMYQPPRD